MKIPNARSFQLKYRICFILKVCVRFELTLDGRCTCFTGLPHISEANSILIIIIALHFSILGYKMLSQDVQMVYRVQDLPSLGILIRSDICLKHCKLNIAHSCLNMYVWLLINCDH